MRLARCSRCSSTRPALSVGRTGKGTARASLQFQSAPVEYCTQSNWRHELSVQGAVVALGKFDAMHKGHRQLAVTATQAGGHPYLISFSGMAEVLGWPAREPVVAQPDRARVLQSWAAHCRGLVPRQRYLPFNNVRAMSPEDFVRYLARDLRAIGVVAGCNYRFGYKAAGDAEALQRLGRQYGLAVEIVELVNEDDGAGPLQVSSSRVREALSEGRMDVVSHCLDRSHRLVLDLNPASITTQGGRIHMPAESALNLLPAPGSYLAAAQLVASSAAVAECPELAGGGAVELLVGEGDVAVPQEVLAQWVDERKTFGYLLLDIVG